MRPPNQARPSRTGEERAIGSGNSRRNTLKCRRIALLPVPNGISSIPVIVGGVCVLTEKRYSVRFALMVPLPVRCRRRRGIATHGIGIVQYRDLGASGERGVSLPCADLSDKSERSVQDAAICHRGPTMLEDEGSIPCSPQNFLGPAQGLPRLQRINARESRLSLD